MAKKEKSLGSFIGKTIALILCLVLVLAIIAVIVFSVGENIVFYKFYKNADKAFKIPGLWTGSVPQGFEYIEDTDTFLYTGYQKDEKTASVIYIMPEGGEGEAREVSLLNKDGSAYTGHAGGITIFEETVFIATGSGVDIFSADDVLDGDDEAKCLGKLDIDFDVAFCEVYEGRLFVGNFYREIDYETPENHHMTTPCGDKNTAVIYEFVLDSTTDLPTSYKPEMVYSIRDAIQGLAFDDEGRMILSSSWGLSKSHIYVYEKPEFVVEDGFTVSANDTTYKADLCYLDGNSLKEDIVAPPMAEELVYHDGKLYIMNEAASMKYIFGKITGAAWCYAYSLD
ncbi:MAG: hypothetical protein IJW10_01750 [Clostridia bacterium]|nr:hypothetical protein [Clostridia bacterium]